MNGSRAGRSAMLRPDVVVLGLGNPLLSDDGLGIEALAALGRSPRLPGGVRLVDGGTAGAALLHALAGCDGLVVLDAVEAGRLPGEVVRVDLRRGLNARTEGDTAALTLHAAALATVLGDLILLRQMPDRAVLFGVQPARVSPGTSLSSAAARGVGVMVEAALDELGGWMASGECRGTGNANVKAWTEDDR